MHKHTHTQSHAYTHARTRRCTHAHMHTQLKMHLIRHLFVHLLFLCCSATRARARAYGSHLCSTFSHLLCDVYVLNRISVLRYITFDVFLKERTDVKERKIKKEFVMRHLKYILKYLYISLRAHHQHETTKNNRATNKIISSQAIAFVRFPSCIGNDSRAMWDAAKTTVTCTENETQ